MSENRINVGISPEVHALATQASGLTVESLQDFVTTAARDRASKVISDFRAGKQVHSRRDNREAKKKQS